MADDKALIVLDKVNKWFGQLHVLQDVDLSVGRGEVVVVIGPSGSGKSTLCRAINRLEPINSGTITFDGRSLPAEGRALDGIHFAMDYLYDRARWVADHSFQPSISAAGKNVVVIASGGNVDTPVFATILTQPDEQVTT